MIWIICAGFSSYIANQKNRSATNWFVLGLLFGIFALISIAAIPSIPKINTGSNKNIGGGLNCWMCSGCGQLNGFVITVCSKCGKKK